MKKNLCAVDFYIELMYQAICILNDRALADVIVGSADVIHEQHPPPVLNTYTRGSLCI